MKQYKIVRFRNGLGKDLFFIKKRKFWFFWSYLIFSKNSQLINNKLTKEAYMFDSLDRAESLVEKVKKEKIQSNEQIVKYL